jgi:oligoendopeptidase F
MQNENSMIQGPSWDNSSEYISIECDEIKNDLSLANKNIQHIEKLSCTIHENSSNLKNLKYETTKETIHTCQQISILFEHTSILLSNVSIYANCFSSVDGKNDPAKKIISKVQELFSKLEQASNAQKLFLSVVPEEFIQIYLDHKETKHQKFNIARQRSQKDHLLSLDEENITTALAVTGFTAWGNLYDSISSNIICGVNQGQGIEKMGIAKATSLLQSHDANVRLSAYQAIQEGWSNQSESCAAALNAISGWRLEQNKRRSKILPMNVLTEPLYDNRMSKETLNALIYSIHEAKDIAHQAVKLRAKILGKDRLHPCDLFAPPLKNKLTKETKVPFQEAMKIIIDSFAKINPEMGEFAEMMYKNKWIEGTVSNNKRPGAYCTKFQKSQTPRVYMTYMGGMKDISTLAHELGHAFHNWVMRDLPHCQQNYPMNLAETASIFAETVVTNALSEKASNLEELFPIAWEDAVSAEAFLLNIPSRFHFENEFYELRKQGCLSANDFTELMEKSWKNSYENTLSEMNKMFWASKLHFYITKRSFYNFPYTFGYLFSLGVYAQKDFLGKDFYNRYVNLLKDTGRMDAENLVTKHLNKDITKPEFWQESIQIIKNKMDKLEKIILER